MRNEEWTKKAVIKRTLIKDGSGPVLFYENGSVYVNDGEGHVIWLGESGTGKSRRGLILFVMTILKHLESAVIVDPKGEIYRYTRDMISDFYDVHVNDYRKIFEPDAEGWNPLSAPYKLWISNNPKDKHDAEQMIADLAYTMYPETKDNDPFWINEARALFLGVVHALFSYANPEEVNLASCYYLISQGEERLGASTYLREFVKLVSENEDVAMQLQSFVTTASDTAGGIRSVFLDGLSQYARSEYIRKFLSHDELCISELKGDKPTLIYIILPDETKTFDHIAAVMCSQLMNHYIRIADQDYQGKLPIRVNFLLDELGNIGNALRDTLPHLLSAGRSRNIRCGIVLQSLSQLNRVFGSDNAQTITSNCGVRIVYRVLDFETLSELSKLCGERELSFDGHLTKEPLITPSQLAAMETGQALVMVSGKVKFITWLPDFTETDIAKYRPPKIAGLKRRHSSKYSYFDIQEFVKRVKHKERYKDNDLYVPAPEEPFVRTNPFLPSEIMTQHELDDIIKRIDKELADFEVEEKKKKKGTNNKVRVVVTCKKDKINILCISL